MALILLKDLPATLHSLVATSAFILHRLEKHSQAADDREKQGYASHRNIKRDRRYQSQDSMHQVLPTSVFEIVEVLGRPSRNVVIVEIGYNGRNLHHRRHTSVAQPFGFS